MQTQTSQYKMQSMSMPTDTVRDFTVPGIAKIHGVTFDGRHLWAVDGTQPGLVAVDPETGRVVRRLPIPGDAGLAFDGKHLWVGVADRIWKVDPETGVKLSDIPAPDPKFMSGLAWVEGTLFVGSYRGSKIFKLDPATGNVLSTLSSDRFVTGITFTNGELWHGAYREADHHVELRRVDETGAVLERVSGPKGVFVSGIEADGQGRLWVGSAEDGHLRAVKNPASRR